MSDPKTRPREMFGYEYEQGEYPTQSEYPSGIFSAAGRSFLGAAQDVERRWASLFDTKESITKEQFQEMKGDRDIKWSPNMDRRLAEFLVDEHDHQEYMAQYESRPIAEFLGGIPPYVADPINIATMPVGGTSMAKAIGSQSLKQFTRHSLASGAKIGVVSAPMEAVQQQQAYGEIRPAEFAMATAAPVIMSPIMAAPAKYMRGFRSGADATSVSRATQPEAEPVDVGRAIQVLNEDHQGVRLPPQMREPGGLRPPDARLHEMFDNYGGPRQWVRDLAQNKPEARKYSERLNIDPDSSSLRNFLNRHREASVHRRKQSLSQRYTQLRDFEDYVQGRARPEQTERLRSKGLLQEADEVRTAYDRPGPAREGEDIWRMRQAEAKQKELAQLESHPAFKKLGEAVKKPGALRSIEDMQEVNNFLRRGADGAYDEYIKNTRKNWENTLQEIRQIDDAIEKTSKKAKKKRQNLQNKKGELTTRLHELGEELDASRAAVPEVDGEFPMQDFMAAVDASRLESPRKLPSDYAPATGEGTAPGVRARDADADPELADVERFASEQGIETDDIKGFAQGLLNHIREC